ncbi:MAG TPA: LytTR family DNA-binding domain-containing protein [Chryseolinea sp.]|jgi:DNA-binding LytR/AlgR family response regulator|nr:LytTR family DNA-binding domain-containing protein [Chryseolinea sp.]
MKLTCLIVEDEPIAQDILKSYIDKTDFFEISAQVSNAIDAFTFLQNNPVNLLFLDIKMPQMSGIELLRALSNKPKVIITSAYRDYAIEAFDLDVVDYLLKPFSFERFLRAVGKAFNDTLTNVATVPAQKNLKERSFFFVKGNKQLQKIYVEDIAYIESQRDYLKFKLVNEQEIITRQTIGYYEQFLPAQLFIRIHRSFIVAIDKIKTAEVNRLMIGQQYLPIGRNYKQHVFEHLKTISTQPDLDQDSL